MRYEIRKTCVIVYSYSDEKIISLCERRKEYNPVITENRGVTVARFFLSFSGPQERKLQIKELLDSIGEIKGDF